MIETIAKPKISFENTEIAFSSKTNSELRRAYWLFKVINVNFLVKVGPPITMLAMNIGLPIKSIIKATIFKHFCGGETINDCDNSIELLRKYKVGGILDYSVEGVEDEKVFENTTSEILATIIRAGNSDNIPFAVFKITGIARFALLEKIQRKESLSQEEEAEFAKVKRRVDLICARASKNGIPIMFDAEETWIQDVIDDLCIEMMKKYNHEFAVVYNTYQLYRHDRLAFLKKNYQQADQEGYFLGAKLVRGAYMEKERKRAEEQNYPSPIQPDKASTDRDYDLALAFCVEHLHKIGFVAGTHNEDSCRKLTEFMTENGVAENHQNIFFSQLLGMSDNLSFNLAHEGFNVAKYVPYGPVKAVLPYLFRRANENTAIAGQMGRELKLIVSEMKRRKMKFV